MQPTNTTKPTAALLNQVLRDFDACDGRVKDIDDTDDLAAERIDTLRVAVEADDAVVAAVMAIHAFLNETAGHPVDDSSVLAWRRRFQQLVDGAVECAIVRSGGECYR